MQFRLKAFLWDARALLAMADEVNDLWPAGFALPSGFGVDGARPDDDDGDYPFDANDYPFDSKDYKTSIPTTTVTDSKTNDWVVKFRAAVAQNESQFIYGPPRGVTSKTLLDFYVTMEGVANIVLATDQIGHGVVSAVLTDIEPESARDYGGWFSWLVIFAVYEERSLHPLPLPTMHGILVEELDARCRIYHFPPDEDSSFLTI